MTLALWTQLLYCGGLILVGVLSSTAMGQTHATAPQPPSVILRRGDIVARVYLPDAEKGHYRGSRFDWSGMIASLTLKDHVFWEKWNLDDKPDADDSNATGPAMEFGMTSPLGFDEALPGDGFIKIGVGVFKRPDLKPYFFRTAYETIDRGKWSIQTADDASHVTFTHELSLKDYGYRWIKRVEVTKDNDLLIVCELINTGRRAIKTDAYVHNFFRLGGKNWQPGTTIQFDQAVRANAKAKSTAVVEIQAERITTKDIGSRQTLWLPLDFDPQRPPRRWTIQHDGLQLTNSVDFDTARLVIYAQSIVFCIEPFIAIDLAPGKTLKWSYRYSPRLVDTSTQDPVTSPSVKQPG